MATVQAIYGLAGRQTQGFLQSVYDMKGRPLAIGNLEFRNLRPLLAGRPFILRGEFLSESFSNPILKSRIKRECN
jgi:hypothetical protein